MQGVCSLWLTFAAFAPLMIAEVNRDCFVGGCAVAGTALDRHDANSEMVSAFGVHEKQLAQDGYGVFGFWQQKALCVAMPCCHQQFGSRLLCAMVGNASYCVLDRRSSSVLESARMLCRCMMGHAVWWGHHPQQCAPAVYRMAALFSQGVHDLLLT